MKSAPTIAARGPRAAFGDLADQAGEHGLSPPALDRLSAVLELRSWLEAIALISAAVNNMEPLPNVLNAIADTTCRLLGYDFGSVLLADARNEHLLIRGSHGLSPSYVESINSERPIKIGHGTFGEGPSSRAFRTRRAVVVRDYLEDPSVGPWAGVAVEQGFRTMASVPLVVSGRAIGTLNCYTRAVHDFVREELLLLATIANQAAIAIEAGRLREPERATIVHLEDARRSLESQTALLQRSEAIHTQLTAAVLDDAGLDAIADALTRVLGGSIVIDDAGGTIVASAVLDDRPAQRPRPDGDATFAGLVGDVLAGQVPRELTLSDHPAFSVRTFLAPIVIGKEVVGGLWVLGAGSPLNPLERRALEHGATVVALVLLKQRTAAEVEARLRGELLDDVLGDQALDAQALRVRAMNLGHDLAGQHRVVVMSLDTPAEGPEPGPALVASRTRRLVTLVQSLTGRTRADALVGERNGAVVALLAERTDRAGADVEFADMLRREVRGFLPGASITVSIGPAASDLASYRRSYRIAVGALELARRSGSGDRTVTLDRLGVYGLLLSVERLDELVAFAARTLEPLRDYDERKSSELVETLRAYLSHSCRAAQTAEALVVHPNTVAYRMRRIESLLGMDLSRPESQLHLQLALVVDDIAGPPSHPVTAP